MPAQKDRIIIDTNLWISFLVTKNFSKLDRIFSNNQVTLIFSAELLDEFISVTQRQKFKKYFPIQEVQNLVLAIQKKGKLINVTSKVEICRDPKDNFLLALALDGNATHLLTGDGDLLVIKKVRETIITTINEYLSI